MSDKERRTVTLDAENDKVLEESDNASAIVNDLVEQYRKNGDRGTAALELQREQKQRELKNAKRKVENLEQDIAELDALIREYQREEDAELQEAREKLAETPKEPDNPAIKSWAKDLGLTPEQLLDELDN
jgi:predicted RNase H-like nuclease (RuvC/YqgF family)